MKIKKVAILIAIITFFTTVLNAVPTFAQKDETEKYDILVALGFFDADLTYLPDASVTRYEIVNAIISSMPDDRILVPGDSGTGFTDVLPDDSIASVAYNASFYKILGEETEFRPYDKATYEEAVFMILNVLGYWQIADSNGVKFATQLGVTKSAKTSQKLTMSMLVDMLYNMLDTKVLRKDTNGNSYSSSETETYMEEVLNVRREKGQVRANRFTGIDGENTARAGYIVIGNQMYNTGSINADNFIGSNVDFYYVSQDNEFKLLYIKNDNKSQIVELEAQEILSFSNMKYTYAKDKKLSRKRTVQILKSSDIIYNGKLVMEDFNSFKPDEGKVRLIDNDDDNYFEVVIIEDYDTVVVGCIDKTKGIITDANRTGVEYSVDLYKENKEYSVSNSKGEVRKFTDIFLNDVIFVARSNDKKFTKIIISDKNVSGSVTGYSGDWIEIDGILYEYTKDFLTYYSPKFDTYGTFYLDPSGKVGAYKFLEEPGIKSGYLIAARIVEHDEYDTTLMLKMFTEDGELKILYPAKKFYFTDGNADIPKKERVTNIDLVKNALVSAMSEEFGGGQLVLYKQNSDGRIIELESAASYTEDVAKMEALDKAGILRQSSQKITNQYKSGIFTLRFCIGAGTKVYKIPTDLEDTEKFAVYTGTTNMFQAKENETAIAFKKKSDFGYVDYVLGFSGSGDQQYDANKIFIATQTALAINDEDVVVPVVTGMWGGVESNFYLDEELADEVINPGDVLRLGVEDDTIVSLLKVYDINQFATGNIGGIGYNFGGYSAYAYDYDGTDLKISFKEPESVTKNSELLHIFTDKFEAIYKYDSEEKKVVAVDYTAVKTYTDNPEDYSKVFIWLYFGDHKAMVIYD